jgi:hypothetical protein
MNDDDRKQKREPELPNELEIEETGFILEPAQLELGSGYTLCVNYDENDKPVINIKTYGQVDMTRLRKEILHAFPNAQIRQMNQSQTTTIVKKRRKRNKK